MSIGLQSFQISIWANVEIKSKFDISKTWSKIMEVPLVKNYFLEGLKNLGHQVFFDIY